jgi:hypothetical protein
MNLENTTKISTRINRYDKVATSLALVSDKHLIDLLDNATSTTLLINYIASLSNSSLKNPLRPSSLSLSMQAGKAFTEH